MTYYVVKYQTKDLDYTHHSIAFNSVEKAEKLLGQLQKLKNNGDSSITCIDGLYKVQEEKIT
jgi:hypothetical protein